MARVTENGQDAPATVLLSPLEWEALFTKIHKKPPPKNTSPPTLQQAILWIGRLGGHLGRKSDGMPGVRTLWRGYRDLQLIVDVYAAFQNPS